MVLVPVDKSHNCREEENDRDIVHKNQSRLKGEECWNKVGIIYWPKPTANMPKPAVAGNEEKAFASKQAIVVMEVRSMALAARIHVLNSQVRSKTPNQPLHFVEMGAFRTQFVHIILVIGVDENKNIINCHPQEKKDTQHLEDSWFISSDLVPMNKNSEVPKVTEFH